MTNKVTSQQVAQYRSMNHVASWLTKVKHCTECTVIVYMYNSGCVTVHCTVLSAFIMVAILPTFISLDTYTYST